MTKFYQEVRIIPSHTREQEASINYKVRPVNKGQPRGKQNMVFTEKWSLFGGYFVILYQGRVIEVWPLFTVWSLFRDGL